MRQPTSGDVYINEGSYITIGRVKFVLEEYKDRVFVLTETGRIVTRHKLRVFEFRHLVFLA